jgi:prefoldin subunit 5
MTKTLDDVVAELQKSNEKLDRLERTTDQRLDEVTDGIGQLQATQTALANVVTQFLGEVAAARSLEKRVEKLEATVFSTPSKQ